MRSWWSEVREMAREWPGPFLLTLAAVAFFLAAAATLAVRAL